MNESQPVSEKIVSLNHHGEARWQESKFSHRCKSFPHQLISCLSLTEAVALHNGALSARIIVRSRRLRKETLFTRNTTMKSASSQPMNRPSSGLLYDETCPIALGLPARKGTIHSGKCGHATC